MEKLSLLLMSIPQHFRSRHVASSGLIPDKVKFLHEDNILVPGQNLEQAAPAGLSLHK